MKARTFGRDLWVSWSGIIVVLLVWQFMSTTQMINPRVFPGPLEVLNVALTRIPFGEVLDHMWVSLLRVGLGFAFGVALGILIGVASGWYRLLGKVIWLPLELLRPIPPLAWLPFALIWFGLGEESKVFIIFLGAFFPIITNTYKGMVGIDPALLRVAQTMGLSGWQILIRVAIPGSMPDIATGVRIGWSLSFGSLVAAEILGAQRGLGFMIMQGRELGEISRVVYGIILIGILNLITDYLINEFFLKRQLRWHFDTQSE